MPDRASELRSQLRSTDADTLFSALTAIGKERIYAMEADVVPFLAHRSGMIRGRAAWTLGFQLHRADHLPAIAKIAQSDPDEDARQDAILAWATLRAGSKDPDLLALFDAWLRDPDQEWLVRATAFQGLLLVSGLPKERWPKPGRLDNIERDVPWALVDELLRG
jgi:HEAT repeats